MIGLLVVWFIQWALNPFLFRAGTNARPEFCKKPADGGKCMGYFPKFYFDASQGKCKEFIYGGCGGNENMFDILAECEKTCAQ